MASNDKESFVAVRRMTQSFDRANNNTACHSNSVEYASGAHEYPTTGIFESEPKQCNGCMFWKSILMGWMAMSIGVMEELVQKYRGISNKQITKNCNHLCNDACDKLTGFLFRAEPINCPLSDSQIHDRCYHNFRPRMIHMLILPMSVDYVEEAATKLRFQKLFSLHGRCTSLSRLGTGSWEKVVHHRCEGLCCRVT